MHLLCLFYCFAFHKKHIYFSNWHFFWHLCHLWAMCENTHISTLQFLLKNYLFYKFISMLFVPCSNYFHCSFLSVTSENQSYSYSVNIRFKSFSNCCLNDILSLTIKRNKWKFLEHRSHQQLLNKNNTVNYI